MKKLTENNIWNKFVAINMALCLIATIGIVTTGRASKFDILVIMGLGYLLVLRITLIKNNKKQIKNR